MTETKLKTNILLNARKKNYIMLAKYEKLSKKSTYDKANKRMNTQMKYI